MHFHFWGSHLAKFDDDNFNSLRNHLLRDTHTDTHTWSRFYVKFFQSNTKNKKQQPNKAYWTNAGTEVLVLMNVLRSSWMQMIIVHVKLKDVYNIKLYISLTHLQLIEEECSCGTE